jgi:hypothetical protein
MLILEEHFNSRKKITIQEEKSCCKIMWAMRLKILHKNEF